MRIKNLALLMLLSGHAAAVTNPILFVGQVPVQQSFGSMVATFGNQQATLDAAPRGGGLFIRYPDGTVKDLTTLAGYGTPNGMQGANAIAVRDPFVAWGGKKAVFSMLVGAPAKRYQVAPGNNARWQLYEVTGLGKSQTPVITKVPGQRAEYNNIYPCYDSNGSILYVSDAPPVNNSPHLYPPLDEYELSPINSGVWRVAGGKNTLLNHAPSGDFKPFVDSFGRVLFAQWDHLQRDQQADADALGTGNYGTFNYASEAATAAILPRQEEVFPEPRSPRTDLLAGTPIAGHNFNQFFPWQMNQDGSEVETLNHVGRQELGGSYMSRNRTDDPAITDDYGQYPRANNRRINNIMQISESPQQPGLYYAVDAPEFGTFAGGQIIRFFAPPGQNPDSMTISYITHRDTASASASGTPNHSGFYRDPLMTLDGTLVASHTSQYRQASELPLYSYDFRLKTLKALNGVTVPDQPLTGGIYRDVSWWSPDNLMTYKGNLWELFPVEVRARPVPPMTAMPALPSPEQTAFAQAGVDAVAFRAYLKNNGLALLVSRNVTQRDFNDRQQPFNLQVPGGVKNAKAGQTVYSVNHARFFQGNLLRGWTGGYSNTPRPGRRVLATPMKNARNPVTGLGYGTVNLGLDGSLAAIVPARRAMTWQLNDPSGKAVVRERYWVTFQPGEVRVCASCHGINTKDQLGHAAPVNTPQALTNLLQWWKTQNPVTP